MKQAPADLYANQVVVEFEFPSGEDSRLVDPRDKTRPFREQDLVPFLQTYDPSTKTWSNYEPSIFDAELLGQLAQGLVNAFDDSGVACPW